MHEVFGFVYGKQLPTKGFLASMTDYDCCKAIAEW